MKRNEGIGLARLCSPRHLNKIRDEALPKLFSFLQGVPHQDVRIPFVFFVINLRVINFSQPTKWNEEEIEELEKMRSLLCSILQFLLASLDESKAVELGASMLK